VYVPVSWKAEGPALLRFNVGLASGAARLPLTARDGQALESAFAGEAGLVPFQWPQPGPLQDALFANQIRLAAIELPPEPVRPGSAVTVTLQWEAVAEVGEDYVGFIHLLDPAGMKVAQDDHLPADGSYPTRLWPLGAVISDLYRLEVPAVPDQGTYQLWGGLYRPGSGERLAVVSPVTGERWKDDLVSLGSLEVATGGP
jgi:hypothetical protein